jgi:starch synthase (maltosyl-transferring)
MGLMPPNFTKFGYVITHQHLSPIGRLPILQISPVVDEGRWAAKAFAGEVIEFAATIFREGHDALGGEIVLTSPSGAESLHRLSPGAPGTDRWQTLIRLDEVGTHRFKVNAFADNFETWHHNTEVKLGAKVDEELMMLEGIALFESAILAGKHEKSTLAKFADFAKILAEKSTSASDRFAKINTSETAALLWANPIRSLETTSQEFEILCERTQAGRASWYEFFPRSEGAKFDAKTKTWKSGTFKTAAKRLPAVKEMGFEVLYMPPIHPIGRSFRKGPNNTLVAGEGDPGSPWAIGAKEGGHDAIHPELGTESDFKSFVKAANKLGLEVAMDLALQASPDHPWVKAHPEWFTTRADGSIAYAENPPKKYQDIFPINFDNDPEGIYQEVLRIVLKWVGFGVKIFRVDNPHTKPVDFWEWLISEVNALHPEVVFLAEAFTRPAMMHTLGKVGFQQSYTYFTWRNSKSELESYFNELAHTTSAFFRPNLWVNTPDILTEYLQFGGKAAFKVRAALAATGAPSWGMYAGFELLESVARQGAEEYIDNEKFEFRPRDFAAAEKSGKSIAQYIKRLNQIRAENQALWQLRNLFTHWSDDGAIFVFSKHLSAQHSLDGKSNTIIVVANVDPHAVRETTVHLNLEALGLANGSRFQVEDLITGNKFEWGSDNFVRLDSFSEPAHILRVIRAD